MVGGILRRAVAGVAIVGLVALAAPDASASGGWTVETTANPGSHFNQLQGVSCTSATACTAVGFDGLNATGGNEARSTLAERWNGTSWTVQPTPNTSGASSGIGLLSVSCVSATSCTAVGFAGEKSLAEHWNGTRWFVQPTPAAPSYGLLGVSCTSNSVCTAVGQAPTGSSTKALVERFTGTKWTVQPTPNISGQSSFLVGVSCTSVTACMAVGYTENASDTQTEALAERWNGSNWTILSIPIPPGSRGSVVLGEVSCTSATGCIAVGRNGSELLAERWDGSKWLVQATPGTSIGGGLGGVSCFSATACTAVGSLSEGDWNTTTIAVWNGSAWRYASGSVGGAGVLHGVSCTSATGCTVVGENANSNTPDTTTLAGQHS